MSVRTLQEFLASSREKDASPDAFELESPHLLEVRLNGLVWAKSGAMVARKGRSSSPAKACWSRAWATC